MRSHALQALRLRSDRARRRITNGPLPQLDATHAISVQSVGTVSTAAQACERARAFLPRSFARWFTAQARGVEQRGVDRHGGERQGGERRVRASDALAAPELERQGLTERQGLERDESVERREADVEELDLWVVQQALEGAHVAGAHAPRNLCAQRDSSCQLGRCPGTGRIGHPIGQGVVGMGGHASREQRLPRTSSARCRDRCWSNLPALNSTEPSMRSAHALCKGKGRRRVSARRQGR